MRLRSLFLTGLAILTMAGALVPEAYAREPKEWTLAVFMNADNNLDPFGDEDVAEMARVGSNDHLNVVVLHDRQGVGQAGRTTLEYIEPGKVNVVAELEETDMGDYRNLVGFMKTVKEQFPAEKYAMVVWNHGAGWKTNGLPAYRGISFDETSGTHITTEEMGQAVKEISENLGGQIDVLISDACLMQMAEVAYPCIPFTRFIVGSEETEPAKGAPYDDILREWKEGITPAELSGLWARAFAASYNEGSQGKDFATQSVIDCARYPVFIEALNAFCQAIVDAKPRNEVLMARKTCMAFADRQNIDLFDFAGKLGEVTTNQPLKDACAALIKAGKEAVPVNCTAGWAYDEAYGIAIYLPITFMPEVTYRYLSFTKETKWLKFMLSMFGGKDDLVAADLRNGKLDSLRERLAGLGTLTPPARKAALANLRSEILAAGPLPATVAAETSTLFESAENL